MSTRRKLLVVVDPTADEQPALTRAARLARGFNAELELFICDPQPHTTATRLFAGAAAQAARDRRLTNHRSRLETLAASLRHDGLRVDCDVRPAHPLDQGILAKVEEIAPLLVLKDTHFHPAVKRTVFSNTDWNLIRSCTRPLMLVKPRAIGASPTIVAAVDPTHEHDRRTELDREILSVAKELATALSGHLHAFHAFDPAPVIASASSALAAPVVTPIDELVATVEQRHREAFAALLASHPVDSSRQHFVHGSADRTLVELAQTLEADFVVMGAVSRGAFGRVFIGSTAERVLDQLPCDLLVVRVP